MFLSTQCTSMIHRKHKIKIEYKQFACQNCIDQGILFSAGYSEKDIQDIHDVQQNNQYNR